MNPILTEISEALQKGKAKIVKELVEQALADGLNAKEILDEGLLSGMDVIAVKFKNNEVYVPEVLIAARAMNAGTALLKPYLAEGGVTGIGKAIIGTVKGDLHDIGKNLVSMLLENNGFTVIDLGADVSPQGFVAAAKEHAAQIVGLSALLTTTMPKMAETVAAFAADGSRESVKIIIGGAPVTEEYAREIQADGYAEDAVEAVALCERLLNLAVE